MYRILAITAIIVLLLLVSTSAARDWFYYDFDGSQVQLALCDSLVTIDLDSAYESGKTLMVPGLDPDYTPVPTALGYWQYGVEPGYDIDTLLADLRDLDEVDFATPTFQLTEDQVWYVYNELLVSFKESVSPAQIEGIVASYYLEVVTEPTDWYPSYLLRQTEDSPEDVFDLCAELYESGLCHTAFPNIYGVPEPCFEPNDTYYDRQWNLHHDASFIGKEGADLDMEAAWDYAEGNDETIIAIIDWGFDVDHEDVDNSRFRRAFDAGGTELRFKTPDFDPDVPNTIFIGFPHYWHGTAVLGIIAAVADNDQGVAGIAANLKVMPVKMMDDYGGSNWEVISMAFQWAEYWGADVVFSALHIPVKVPNVTKAIEYGWQVHGSATIVAAGNDGTRPIDLATLPTTFVVGGSDHWDNIWEHSNRGPGVDILAPAIKITTTDITGVYGFNVDNLDADSCQMLPEYYCNYGDGRERIAGIRRGTSAAAAQVAAIAGLIKSRNPQIATAGAGPEQLYEVLRHSAEDQIHANDVPGYDTLFGWWIFAGGPGPQPVLGTGDANCDGSSNISDAVYLISYIFAGGDAPGICFEYDD
jgi:subtilisin family serine protease